jgi:hypothetical protein
MYRGWQKRRSAYRSCREGYRLVAGRCWHRSHGPALPDDESMRVSQETINPALYVLGRGAVRREL